MPTFKKGDIVKTVAMAPEGPILSMRMDDDGVIHYLVEFEDKVHKITHQRWFTENEITGG